MFVSISVKLSDDMYKGIEIQAHYLCINACHCQIVSLRKVNKLKIRFVQCMCKQYFSL